MDENTKEFLSNFKNSKFRYFSDDGNGTCKEGKNSDIILPELNNENNKNGAFFTVNGFNGGQKNENIDCINAFFIDIDWDVNIKNDLKLSKISEVWQDMASMDCEPSYIVESKKGCHCYWILNTPVLKSDFADERWNKLCQEYTGILKSLTTYWGADMAAATIGRVLRIPTSKHWKDSSNPFTIKIWSDSGIKYNYDFIAKLFPAKTEVVSEKNEFPIVVSDALSVKYPRIDRPSTKALLKIDGGHIKEGARNKSLHIACTLLRDSGVSLNDAIAMFPEYHGIVAERGIGALRNTIRSAYSSKIVYGTNNEFVAPFVTPEERATIAKICKDAFKVKREADEAIFQTYEHKILKENPLVRRDNIGRFYEYTNGVYVVMEEGAMETRIYSMMDKDELYQHKTRSKIADKIASFSSLISTVGFNPDSDSNIINVRNGLLNVETLKLSNHTPDYISISQLPFDFDPQAQCIEWENYLYGVMKGDFYQIDILQRFSGYCLTSDVSLHKALILLGNGRNGKSLFMKILSSLVGRNNTLAISMEQMNERFALSGLYGKKIMSIEEVSNNKIETRILKNIITGGTLTCDVKYKDAIEFEPCSKVIMTLNRLPRLSEMSTGIFERFYIVEFLQEYSLDNKPGTLPVDKDLGSRILKEMSGVLNWALAGLQDLRRDGKINITQKNTDALLEYRLESNHAHEYMDEFYETSAGSKVEFKDVYNMSRDFFMDNGYSAMGKIKFKENIKSAGYSIIDIRTKTQRITYIDGIAPREHRLHL